MKYYDKNGNIHTSLLKLIWYNLTSDLKPRITISQRNDVKLKHGDEIIIDYQKNKIYLIDSYGETICESDIDSKLNSKGFENINMGNINLNLSEELSSYIDKIQSVPNNSISKKTQIKQVLMQKIKKLLSNIIK